MRIVFMGTPDFSVSALESLIQSEHEVAAVVTQPDKQKGRGKKIVYTPVKECAMKYQIPVYQPIKVREPEFVEKLLEINPDIIVVVAFGQLLTKEILELPKYGCVNIHASLLPKYRGAAPIQRVILDGEQKTGVTTMQMNEGLDTGDILEVREVVIEQEETGETLHDKLQKAGGELILTTLQHIKDGSITRTKQDDSQSNYAKMLKKELGNIDFTKSAVEIERLIRGLNPWPSAYTFLHGKTWKIWSAKVLSERAEGVCGEIIEVTKDSIIVQTGKGCLELLEIQMEGKKRMPVEAFLRGYQVEKGEKFHHSKQEE